MHRARSICACAVVFALASTIVLARNTPNRFIHFESPQTAPMALTDDGERLLVVNTPDNRLSVFDTATLALVTEVPVGLEPVGVAVRPGTREAWVANHLSDTVDVVDIDAGVILATIRVGDEPAAIVFGSDGRTAWVTLSQPDAVVAIHAKARSVSEPIAIAGAPMAQDPRALAVSPDGRRLYVLPFESGNRTRGRITPAIEEPSVIVSDPALPDVDLTVIDTTGRRVVSTVENLGTILTNLRVSPDGNRLYVVGWDARNLEAGLEPLDGRPNVNRLVVLDRASLTVTRRVDLPAAQPHDVAFDDRDRVWVAAQGNDDVVLLDGDGAPLRRIATGVAPRALLFDAERRVMYVFHRVGHEIVAVSTQSDAIVARTSIGFDPTPGFVRDGQRLLYSAERSADGLQACASCHADAHHDNLVWDLGDVVDPKGPMVTQSLRGLRDNAPYHWRGERKTLEDFNVFDDLFDGEPLSDEDNAKLAAYLESIEYPPNPGLAPDGSVQGALAECGRELFFGQQPLSCPPVDAGEARQTFRCATCHTMPSGSNHGIIPRQVLLTHDDMEVTQLRGMHEKVAFLHDGTDRSIAELLDHSPPFPPFPDVDRHAMEAFLLEFPSEHHAAVGSQITLDAGSCVDGDLDTASAAQVTFLEQLAEKGAIDLTATGRILRFGRVHLLYMARRDRYRLDRNRPRRTIRSEGLEDWVCAGRGALTYTAWPAGTGFRAIDRDLDGILNGNDR